MVVLPLEMLHLIANQFNFCAQWGLLLNSDLHNDKQKIITSTDDCNLQVCTEQLWKGCNSGNFFRTALIDDSEACSFILVVLALHFS